MIMYVHILATERDILDKCQNFRNWCKSMLMQLLMLDVGVSSKYSEWSHDGSLCCGIGKSKSETGTVATVALRSGVGGWCSVLAFIYIYFAVLGLALSAYTLSHSTSPSLQWIFSR
jgi:hypothetical protein